MLVQVQGPLKRPPLCLPKKTAFLPRPENLGAWSLGPFEAGDYPIRNCWAGLGFTGYAPAGAAVWMCVICVLYSLGGGGGQVVAECRAHAGAVGQCTPVKGWMKVGTAGLVGIMPLELGRRSLRGLRSCRQSVPRCRRSCVGRRASLWQSRVEARPGLGRSGTCAGGRVKQESVVSGGRDGSPTRRRDDARADGGADWESRVEGEVVGGGRWIGCRRRVLWLWLLVWWTWLVPSCRRVHGRQLEGKLEIRSSKRSWTI